MLWDQTKTNLSKPNQMEKSVPHPRIIQEWEDHMKKWPNIASEDIFSYFVSSLGVDGSEVRSYYSLS
jgi:hypothetical protein